MKNFVVILVISTLALSLFMSFDLASASVIQRIQGPIVVSAEAGGSNPLFVSLNSEPLVGDLLIVTLGMTTYGLEHVASISQTGVLWYKAVNSSAVGINSEIWYGIVWTSASKDITISLTASTYVIVATVCEYSGLAASNILDVTAGALGNGAVTDTGTTINTIQADELWIATAAVTLFSGQYAQSNPLNDFTMVSNFTRNNQDSTFLAKIASSIGSANTGTSVSNQYQWSGCVATFKKAVDITPSPNPTETPKPSLTDSTSILVLIVVWFVVCFILIVRPMPIVNLFFGIFGFAMTVSLVAGVTLPFTPFSNLFALVFSILVLWAGWDDFNDD